METMIFRWKLLCHVFMVVLMSYRPRSLKGLALLRKLPPDLQLCKVMKILQEN